MDAKKLTVVDTFPFFNEYELLEIRLKYLWDVVDVFCIAEGDHTHSRTECKAKPANFLANASRFEWAMPKIRYVYAKLSPNPKGWENEYDQRRACKGLFQDLPKDSVIFHGDLDEIWNKDQLNKIILRTDSCDVALEQNLYYYYLNNLDVTTRWHAAMATRLGRFDDSHDLRERRNSVPVIVNCGWHFSYQGGAQKILEKMHAFAHAEQCQGRNATLGHWSAIEKDPTKVPFILNYGPRRMVITDVPPCVLEPEKYSHMIFRNPK